MNMRHYLSKRLIIIVSLCLVSFLISSCGFYLQDTYKLIYASNYEHGGTTQRITEIDLQKVDQLIFEVSSPYGIKREHVENVMAIMNLDSIEGQILLSYCDNPKAENFKLLLVMEKAISTTLYDAPIIYYYYYLVFHGFYVEEEDRLTYLKLRDDFLNVYRAEYGDNSIIRLKDLLPPKYKTMKKE